ncbi:MAG: hypothetical protein Tsb0020_51530 [Haliangiales bacterium]
MQQLLRTSSDSTWRDSISPLRELGAYESLWAEKGATYKRIADRFRAQPDAYPSDLVEHSRADAMADWVLDHLHERGVQRFGIRARHTFEYPQKLRDARHPLELLTYCGYWNLVESPSVAVVGARTASQDGLARARKLARALAEDGYTIISGLAAGVDTAAHQTALKLGAPTIAVLGTPLGYTYPKENQLLQQIIAREFLVISQVPVYRYHHQDYRANRSFFPERNVTMSALSLATVIVEASDTSGTLSQARAALQQGRKLFILDSCFRKPGLKWPQEFAKKGALRVRDYADIREHLAPVRAESYGANPD